ncbi:hypothetical protein [uncultured Pseudomonas sp.]|uniref:hypothetical protein n=1 Tax=uncultured Pseudomonas sp. TaxID=114707 RepID=UPI0025D0D072|nr:hypothetical protein [uncultured Pseudomonas sp.]
MKKIIFATLALTSPLTMAEDHSITKVSKPGQVNIVKDGVGLAFFNLRFGDFPKASIGKEKHLKKIEWHTTSYPDNAQEHVELCYYPHGSLKQEHCTPINPGSTGETDLFNIYKFESYSYAVIKHRINGGSQPGRASDQDRVTFYYSY